MPEPAARRACRWAPARRQRRGAPLGHAARVRLRAEGPRRHRRGARLSTSTAAAKLAGARFTVLWGAAPRLHRALAQFMLDLQTREHGYTECYMPLHRQRRDAARHRPAAEVRGADLFADAGARRGPRPLYLIPTAECRSPTSCATRSSPRPSCRSRYARTRRASAREAGSVRPGHARHDPPAPVRQGRDGADHRTRSSPTTRWRR